MQRIVISGLAALLGTTVLLYAVHADATQYVVPSSGSGPMGGSGYAEAYDNSQHQPQPLVKPYYSNSMPSGPSASNNYVSNTPNSYPNPYTVPPAAATSYTPVSVPGSGQYQPQQYRPIQATPDPYSRSGVGNGAVDAATTAPAYAPVSETAPVAAPAPQTQVAAASSYGYQDQSGPIGGGGYQALPTYNYDAALDPKNNGPYRAPSGPAVPVDSTPPTQNWHPYWGLETTSGMEIGAQLFYYDYEEPSLSVSETGIPEFGFTFDATGALGWGYWTQGQIKYGVGNVDYKGSGELKDSYVDTWDVRALFGKDFALNREYSISPYLGFGYRNLYNDNTGVTTTGAAGYRRSNNLYYMPFGLNPRTHIDSNARLTANIEYDLMIHGNQKSYFSDAGRGDPDVNNGQNGGYGLRGNIMYETRTWSIGPYFSYWNIDTSKNKMVVDHSAISCAGVGGAPCFLLTTEPTNHTLETGIQFKYRLF